MKLIVGLGNPGTQYAQTRHNVGFRVLDAFASQHNWQWERRGRAMLSHGMIDAAKVTLVKPLTYMNNSGEAVGELLRWYKLQPTDLLVIYDDLDLAIGRVQLKAAGSPAGHNGVANIIHHLHTNEFPRLRVGIGKPANQHIPTIDYVLGTPTGDDHIKLATGESRAVEFIPLILEQTLESAMNIINPDPEQQRKAEEKRRQKLEQRAQKRLLQAAEQAQTTPTTLTTHTNTTIQSDPRSLVDLVEDT
jgi:PTH1 family peptidyl-tRNA hydrolase